MKRDSRPSLSSAVEGSLDTTLGLGSRFIRLVEGDLRQCREEEHAQNRWFSNKNSKDILRKFFENSNSGVFQTYLSGIIFEFNRKPECNALRKRLLLINETRIDRNLAHESREFFLRQSSFSHWNGVIWDSTDATLAKITLRVFSVASITNWNCSLLVRRMWIYSALQGRIH